MAGEKIHCSLQPPAKAYRGAEKGSHPGFQGGSSLGKRMVRKVLHDHCVQGSQQDLRIDSHLMGGGRLRRGCMQTNAVARLTNLYDSHHVVGQHALHNLRHSVKYLADVENVCECIEQTVEDPKAGGKIALRRRPNGSMSC